MRNQWNRLALGIGNQEIINMKLCDMNQLTVTFKEHKQSQ